MMWRGGTLAVIVLGDRLVVVATRGRRLDAFTIDSESPAADLRTELDARQLRGRTVALALARTAATVKPIELPAVGGDLAEMVRFELDRHLPFPAEDAPFDFLPLPAEPAGERETGTRVLLAAADRRVVDAALRLAQDAGLRPSSLTVAPHDLRALVRRERGRRVAWAHRAAGATELLFLAGGSLALSRSLAATDDATLAGEIRRSLATVRWRGVDAVWLSGDGAPAPDALAGLGAPVGEPPWTPRARAWLETLPDDDRGAFTLALGVASARGIRPLDLLPRELRPRRLTRAQQLTAGMAAATVALVIAALLVPGYRDQRHVARLNDEIRRIEPDVRAVERVQQDLERKRKLLATIASVETTGVRPLPVLRDLTELVPSEAWLTTLALDAKGIELTGQAAAASALIPLLENSPRFERVEFASPVTRGRDREQFRIRAAWETSPALATGAAAPGPPRPPGRATPALAPSPSAPPATAPPGAPALTPPASAPPGAPAPGPGRRPAPAAPRTRDGDAPRPGS
jgi:Tfp pilus assembly protein PilN